jgi:hypothetical protein
MKPGRMVRTDDKLLPQTGILFGSGSLFLLIVALLFAWPRQPVQAARQPQITGTPAATTPSVFAPPGTGTPGTSGIPVTPVIEPTRQAAPLVRFTPTLVPLPVITFVPEESTPSAVLLSAGGPQAGPGFPKDPSPAWWMFLRRWSVPLILVALWIGLAFWVGVSLYIANRASDR